MPARHGCDRKCVVKPINNHVNGCIGYRQINICYFLFIRHSSMVRVESRLFVVVVVVVAYLVANIELAFSETLTSFGSWGDVSLRARLILLRLLHVSRSSGRLT